MMKFDPMSLQRMNSSIALKNEHDRGLQSILVCSRCRDYLGQQKSSYDLFLSKSIHLGVFYSLVSIKPKMFKRLLNRLLSRYWENVEQRCREDPICQLLLREIAVVGKEFESMEYDRLLEPAETLSFSRVVDGIELSFSAEAYNIKKNGDICFCIDARATPNRTRWQPSYQFFMRKDGTIYH